MAFQSVPNTAEAVVQLLINGENVVLTFYGWRAAGYDQDDIDALAATMDAWVTAELIPAISSSAAYVGVAVRGLELINDNFAFDATGADVGDAAFQPLPNNVAFSVKRFSGLTGRSARGRVYLPLTTNDPDTNENYIKSAAAVFYVAALNEVRVFMALEGWTEVIVSRVTNGAPRTVGEVFFVTGYTNVDLRLDTMRRRLPA